MMVAIDFHSRKNKYYGSQWLKSIVWFPKCFKIRYFEDDILKNVERNVKRKKLTAAIDFYSMEKEYYGSQWLPSTVWLPTFFKIRYILKTIYWRMLVTKQLTAAIDFYSMEKNTMEVNGYHQLFDSNILQNKIFLRWHFEEWKSMATVNF